MSTTPSQESTRWFLHTWRDYVLEPVETALTLLDREQSELAAEKDALERFLACLQEIEPSLQSATPVGPTSEYSSHDPVAELREAYADTVLDVDHFTSVYDETLVENVSLEFGPDYATLFHPESDVQFSPPVKDALVAATEQAIEERAALDRAVTMERDSVAKHQSELTAIIETLDSTVVPEWYHETFTADVDAILANRQDRLHSGSHRFDTHDFCVYLYEEEPWNYPVLTGIARLQESVEVRQYGDVD